MALMMSGGKCRYNDASRLRWRNVTIEPDGSNFHLSFEERKNAKFRQGNRVTVAATSEGPVCPLMLLRMMMLHTEGGGDALVFRGFNGRLVKSEE